MLAQLVRALAGVHAALALPAGQTVFMAPAPDAPSTFSPLLPPAIPLAVKSPYLNAWLSAGGEHGSKGCLAGSWAQHWPTHYPGSDKDYRLSWAGLISIDGKAFEFLGAPLSGAQRFLGSDKIARQIAFEYTATRSIFTFEAGGVEFTTTFLSPVTPNDYVRQSLPFSYLIVDVDPSALKNHFISVYTDISGEWATADSGVDLTWTYTSESRIGVHAISRNDPLKFAEVAEQAEWGQAVYATAVRSGVVAGSGPSDDLRSQFVRHGRLDGSHDVEYRKVNDRQPVFGFSVNLGSEEPGATFTIGHVRYPYVNYVTPNGRIDLSGLWTTKFAHWVDALSNFQLSVARAVAEAKRFDAQLRNDAVRISGDNYAAIVELSTRQAFATFELTTGVREDWQEDKDGVMAHLKEISSNGDMTTIDVIFPLHPILLYTNPTLLALLLEPLLVYTHSGMYPNRWPVHDLGTYPNATGYNAGNDEPMPVEEAGNMLWMALAYFQLSGDKPWVEKHYAVFKQWTTLLTDDGLVPAEQLSTDDFAGTLSNQTDLAVKAIVGIGAMAGLADGIGRWTDWVHYRAVAKAYVKEWARMALTDGSESDVRHAKLAYQAEDSWGILYNLFGDRVLNLRLFDRQLYKDQSTWYRHKAEKYGVPLDSRHAWSKVRRNWFPVLMAGAINGAGAYTPPIGVIRLYFKRSLDLKNVESLTGGKSDPYVRVLYKGLVVARTIVHDNDLNPVYDEIVYVQVHSPRDKFTIEVMDYQHNSKDRSLGLTEFAVEGLVAEGPDAKTQPWVSTGKVAKNDPLKSNGKRTVKGNVEFEAEFFPCAHLKDVSFAPPEASAKITEIAEEKESSPNSSEQSSAAATAAETPANGGSATPSGSGEDKEDEKENEGVTIPREELLKTQTGVLAFQIISGNISKKGARVEVLFDDGYWPAFSTERSRSTHNTWDEIGEALIRELDFSQVILKLNDSEKDTHEDILSACTIDLNTFLEESLDKPATFTLNPIEPGRPKSTVTIMSKYIPVDMQILPRESVNNSGVVRVELLDGKSLPSADRNGKSDPYAVFELNDERVYKSEVIKKTLAPVWNEKFEMQVPSREAAKFAIEVFDWDRVGTPDKLGRALIDLRDIEPFESTERTIVLEDYKQASKPAGQIRIRMVFSPQFIYRTRKATSTFSAGRIGSTLGGIGGGVVGMGGTVGKAGVDAVGQVGKVGVGAVGAVGKVGVGAVGSVGKAGVGAVGTVGKAGFQGIGAVGKGVLGVGRWGHGRKGSHSSTADAAAAGYAVAPETPDNLEVLAADGSPVLLADGVGAPGVLTVTVGQLSNGAEPGEKRNVVVKLNGGKTVLETHSHKDEGGETTYGETGTVKTPASGPVELEIAVMHKKTFGGDRIFSSAALPVWQHVSPVQPSATVTLALDGLYPGQLSVTLSWAPAHGVPLSRTASDADTRSLVSSPGAGTPLSKTRSRFTSSRFGRHARETTPASVNE